MTKEISELEMQIEALKLELAKHRKAAPREEVRDFEFLTPVGVTTLSALFGDRNELVTIHNMGKGCVYCTLWADGFNGLVKHFEDRSAFVVVSPDTPEVQGEFAKSRGWNFTMVSDQDTSFTREMGFLKENEGWWPGVSAFVLEDGKIYRTGRGIFGPGDEYCSIFPIMDLMGGDKNWEPKYSY